MNLDLLPLLIELLLKIAQYFSLEDDDDNK